MYYGKLMPYAMQMFSFEMTAETGWWWSCLEWLLVEKPSLLP